MFTGKERDQESGNDYFGARYYASTMGRFLSPDWSAKEEPVPYAKLNDPQTLNLYSYVQNNPLSHVDADGHAVGVDDAVEAGIVINIGVIATVQAINTVEHMPSASFSDFTSSVASDFKSDASSVGHAISAIFSKGAKGIPKAANAPGVTAGGQATDQYGNKLGPSGDPQVNKTKSNTREAARNKALNEGSGATEHKADGKSAPPLPPD